jgi:hypothetical protein
VPTSTSSGRYPRSVPLRRRVTVPLSFISFVALLAFVACEPRKKANSPTTSSTTTTTAPATTTAAPTSTAPPPPATGTNGIPGLPYGLPVSPRAAIVGKWNVAAIDGKAVPSAGMGTDWMDPATYAAGSGVVFTPEQVSITRGGANVMQRPYKVLSEMAPIRVTIDAGYGPSNIDFSPDGTAIWSLPSTPPHALTLTRAP